MSVYFNEGIKTTICIALVVTTSISMVAQNKFVFEEYKKDIHKVVKSDTIVYYGLDFSNAVFTDPNKLGDDEYCKKYFSAWISYFEAMIKPEEIIVKLLKKNIASKYNPVSIQHNYQDISHKWINISGNSFGTDSLLMIVKSFKLKETSGTGFVINIENLNKNFYYVSAYFTFFDISTKEVLWSVKVKGTPNGSGYSAFWAEGIYDALKKYVNGYYKKEIKKN
jgi:hypothetical protein